MRKESLIDRSPEKYLGIYEVLRFLSSNHVPCDKLKDFPISRWRVNLEGDDAKSGSKLELTKIHDTGLGRKLEFEIEETSWGNAVNFRSVQLKPDGEEMIELESGEFRLADIGEVSCVNKGTSYFLEVRHGGTIIRLGFLD